jgi:hypothetical protein
VQRGRAVGLGRVDVGFLLDERANRDRVGALRRVQQCRSLGCDAVN